MYGSLISAVTVGSGGAASISFSSIPSTYTDLILLVSSRTNVASNIDGIWVNFNGSSTSFDARVLVGTGGPVSVASTTNPQIAYGQGDSNTSLTFGNAFIYIPNYSSSTNKSYSSEAVGENNGTTSAQGLVSGLWSNTAAITSITLLSSNSANFLQNSTAYLYGVTKGSGGATVS